MLSKRVKLIGFTLIELLIVMVIIGILGMIGFKGYMNSLIVERRQDAILSMQKIMLLLQDQPAANLNNICRNRSAFGCFSNGGFYDITYNVNGYTAPATINNVLLNNESLILQAMPVLGKSQTKDLECQIIYLSNQNKIYPSSCGY